MPGEVDAVAAGDPDALEGDGADVRPADVARAGRGVGHHVEVEDVAAAAADQHVGAAAAAQHVVAVRAFQLVDPDAGDQHVVAEPSVQVVVARPARERVRPAVAEQHVAEAGADQVLDARPGVADRVAGVAAAEQPGVDALGRRGVGGGVDAAAADQRVGAAAADQHVVAGAAVQPVGAGAAVEPVVAVAAVERVAGGEAGEVVVAGVADEACWRRRCRRCGRRPIRRSPSRSASAGRRGTAAR